MDHEPKSKDVMSENATETAAAATGSEELGDTRSGSGDPVTAGPEESVKSCQVEGEVKSSSGGATAAPAAPCVQTAPPPDEASESDDTDEDEAILESSPCHRYHKRREQVKYRDVPGIDVAYLAMDNEEGVEVVWNEAKFSSAKKFRAQEENICNVFEALTLIDHPNIVKFHKYWFDFSERKEPRLIFITEFMSSGSLKQFLKTTKKRNRKVQVQSWKRWCIQILSALNHLHTTCDPPIIHGNLNCDTIFIQHNGLVKIGSVAPDIIHHNVKTCKDNLRNLHFFAPEWGEDRTCRGPPIDIYAFGIAALETAALDMRATPPPPNGGGSSDKDRPLAVGVGGVSPLSVDSSGAVTEEAIQRTIDQLEDPMQKDFIRKCLSHDPKARPTAGSLLFHQVLFEVHSLKLLAAHVHVNTPANTNTENVTDEAIQLHYGRDNVMATIKREDGTAIDFKLSDFPVSEKLEKFMEDVKFGVYPLTAYALSQPSNPKTRSGTPEDANEEAQSTDDDKPSSPGGNVEEPADDEDDDDDDDDDDPDNEPNGEVGTVGGAGVDRTIQNGADPVDSSVRYVTNLKVVSSLLHLGPPVPRLHEYIVGVNRLEKSMNRQLSTWMGTADTPIFMAMQMVQAKVIRRNLLVVQISMITRALLQRSREIQEFWELYQAYETEKCKGKGKVHQKEPLPYSLKKYQEWLVDLAKNYGFLDDRPGINDHMRPPDGMIWIHDHDYKIAIDWLMENMPRLTQLLPPTFHAHPDFTNPSWSVFENKLNGNPLIPCIQAKPAFNDQWPAWTGTPESFDYETFPENSPTNQLLAYLNEYHRLHPDAAREPMEAVHQQERVQQDGNLHQVLQADVQAFHYQYGLRHSSDEEIARAKAAAASSDCKMHKDTSAAGGKAVAAAKEPVNAKQLQEALRATAEMQSRAEVDGAAASVAPAQGSTIAAGVADHQQPTAASATDDSVHFGCIEMSAIEEEDRFTELCDQMQRLPQLEENQQYMVVPEAPDGHHCTPIFLNPSQLAHLQAVAATQQPQGSQGQDFGIPAAILHEAFPVFFEQMQQPAPDMGIAAAAAPAARAASASPAVPVVSSPSIDEELIQIAEHSDPDEPHPAADIAGAASVEASPPAPPPDK